MHTRHVLIHRRTPYASQRAEHLLHSRLCTGNRAGFVPFKIGDHVCSASFWLSPTRIATCNVCGAQWQM